MKTFTEKELKEKYPNYKTDLCYIVEFHYELIDVDSFTTDDLDEAKEDAKARRFRVYVFTKQLAKDCLDAYYLLESLVDSIEQQSPDSDWLSSMLSDTDKQDFHSFITKWFNKVVGDRYFATNEVIGELELKNE